MNKKERNILLIIFIIILLVWRRKTPAKKVAEDVELVEDKTISMLTKAAKKSKTRIKFKSGASEEITQDTAKNLLAVYKKLNSKNKQKFEDKLMNSTQDFMKTVEFAMSKA